MKKGKISKVAPMSATYIGNQNKWDIYFSTHSEQRSWERDIPYDDMGFNMSLIIDFFEEKEIINDILDIPTLSKNNMPKIQIRDDINDTCFICAFHKNEKEVHVITCINQEADRIISGKEHTSVKRNCSMAIIVNESKVIVFGIRNAQVSLLKEQKISSDDVEALRI